MNRYVKTGAGSFTVIALIMIGLGFFVDTVLGMCLILITGYLFSVFRGEDWGMIGYYILDKVNRKQKLIDAYPEIKKWEEGDAVYLMKWFKVPHHNASFMSGKPRFIGVTDTNSVVMKMKYDGEELVFELGVEWFLTGSWENTTLAKREQGNKDEELLKSVENSFTNEWLKEYQRSIHEAEDRLHERLYDEPTPLGEGWQKTGARIERTT